MCAYLHTCVCNVCVCECECTFLCVYANMRVYGCIFVCVHTRVCVWTCVHACMNISYVEGKDSLECWFSDHLWFETVSLIDLELQQVDHARWPESSSKPPVSAPYLITPKVTMTSTCCHIGLFFELWEVNSGCQTPAGTFTCWAIKPAHSIFPMWRLGHT